MEPCIVILCLFLIRDCLIEKVITNAKLSSKFCKRHYFLVSRTIAEVLKHFLAEIMFEEIYCFTHYVAIEIIIT